MAEWSADVEIDLDRATGWIRRAFPELADLPVRASGEGWDNSVFRVGEELVVRIPRRTLGASLLDMELGVLPHLAEHLPLAIPVPLRVGGPFDDYPFRFALYRWLEGTTADRAGLDAAARGALAKPLGAFLGALHRCDPGPVALAADPGDTLHRADRTHRLPPLIERLADIAHLDGVDASAVTSALHALMEVPDWHREPVWSHSDLYARHLVVREGQLVGVIDFGDCHRGDPALDLSIGWSFLPPEAHADFLEAYGDVDEATWGRAHFKALHYGINLLRYGEAVRDAEMSELGRLALATAGR